MNHRFLLSSLLVLAGRVSVAKADVVPNPIFTDHAVLQQGNTIPVWGTATPGESVTVELYDQSVTTQAGADGAWKVTFQPMLAGGPYQLTMTGSNRIVLTDILVGEVWIASGQSNMERQLGLRAGQQPIFNWEREVASAKYPSIRYFSVEKAKSLSPLKTVEGQWKVCSPTTVAEFTAVGYFFARELHRARKIPIGIIHSAWGGTPIEAWTSEAGLSTLSDFSGVGEHLKLLRTDPEAAKRKYEAELEPWFVANDLGSVKIRPWSDPTLDSSEWKTMPIPTLWEQAGEPALNGVVWLRKEFDLPAVATKIPTELRLGMVDDIDTTWLNGVKLGTTAGYNEKRVYPIPTGLLKTGRNVIAVRVLDTGGGGGIWGEESPRLFFKGSTAPTPLDLGGPWHYRIGLVLDTGPWPPASVKGDSSTPTVLYNGMVAPLLPYAIRGVIWYQGESNVHREPQYRVLFPRMIADWRRAWSQGDFPFLFVQIAPYRDMTPLLREVQLQVWQDTPNTGMAVTLDCGDANDIHPARKQPVGARLALAARALAYGELIEYSGPVFQSMVIQGKSAVLTFSHLGGGLVAKNGPLKGFTMAGADNVFYPAKAVIRGNTVVVTSSLVTAPVAVRYAWANAPEGNLFNKANLPASPFRTDAN